MLYDTKTEIFGIIEEVCYRIENRTLGSVRKKGCTHIRNWRTGYVGLKEYERERKGNIK